MKEVKYVPKQCESGEFSGFVMVRVPLFHERYEILDQMGVSVGEGGSMKMEDKGSFSSVVRLVAATLPFIKSVEIKHSDGREFKSAEDLQLDVDCDSLLIDVAMAVSRGFRPGKN